MAFASQNRASHTPRVLIYLLGLVSISGLALIEYFTDAVLGLFIASVVPIVLLTVIGGFPVGVVVSIVSAATWLIVDIVIKGGYAELGSPAWNFFIRTTIFLLCTYIFWQINYLRHRQHDLIDFVIHDLRTPLANITMELDMLKQEECGPLTDRQRAVISKAEISSRRLTNLINSLLDLSQFEAGKVSLEKKRVDIGDAMREAELHVSTWAASSGIQLQTIIPPEIGNCEANAPLLLRILINLLGNAIKISPKGSTIMMEVAPENEGTVLFSVKDEGRGIPPKLLKKIFDKFEQESFRLGGGIGLTFCKLAVEAQGGKIWIESEVGQGTTVFFTLPAPRAM